MTPLHPKKTLSLPFLLLMTALIWLWTLAAPRVLAATLFDTPALDKTPLGHNVEFLEDPDGMLSLDDVRSGQHEWRSSKDEVFNRGYNRSAWWLRFDVRNPHLQDHWLLEIAYAVLDHIDIHLIPVHGEPTHYLMGDKQPFAQRPIQHRHFLVPLTLAQGEQVSVYLRVASTSSVQVPLILWNPSAFQMEDIGHSVAEGIYYGGVLIIALYNLLLYLLLGERTYLYYVANVLSMLMFIACLHGWTFQFLWPHAIYWNDTSILFFLSTLLIFAWAFTCRFLDTLNISRLFASAHYLAMSGSFLMLGIALTLPYDIAIRIIIPFAAVSCVWGMISGFASWHKGNHSARYYVLAWSLMLVGGVVMALSKNHLLPRNLITDYATQIGSLLEVLLLSFALAERINQERALRLQAQQEALTVQRQANEALEQRVAERTLALEEANRKLQDLSDTDQLTGLKNRRFLNSYLDKEFSRAARYGHPVAVLMIDVDHFKSVNDNYGHLAGDDCLQETANRIRQQMRWPSDLAARYGGEEFCVVLPETTLEGALTVAERIRARVEATPISSRAGDLRLTVSVGLQVGNPRGSLDAGQFVDQADAALYQAKQRGRNRVAHSMGASSGLAAGEA